MLDAWMTGREPVLKDSNLGDSIDAVEELIRKHEDFEKTVYAQEDKFNAIRRMTLVTLLYFYYIHRSNIYFTMDRHVCMFYVSLNAILLFLVRKCN